MTAKRSRNIMLRLTEVEFANIAAAVPPGEEAAVFVRRTLLKAIDGSAGAASLRKTAAFIVAALSDEVGYAEALQLFDEHVGAEGE